MLLAIPLTLCFTVALAADRATPPVSSAQSGYDLGFAKGQEDGRGGLSRTPDRYESLYSQADRAEFFRGYEAGYNQGIKIQPANPMDGHRRSISPGSPGGCVSRFAEQLHA